MPRISIDKQNPVGYQTFDGFVEIQIPDGDSLSADQKFLHVVNQLLAEQRKFAWDHEAKENKGRGEMFFGSALVRTKEGKYYIAANTHLQNSAATRNSAEANAVTDAAQETWAKNSEISDIWFMGGKGDLSKDQYILDDQLGRRNTPCGSCLDVIFNHKLSNGVQTQIHMLPLNDGSWNLIQDDGRTPAALEKNQVLTRTIGELLPFVSVLLEDRNGRLKQDIARAWDFLKEPVTVAAISSARKAGEIPELRLMEQDGASRDAILAKVNDIMMDTMKREYQKAEGRPLKKGVLSIVRTEEGTYHMGWKYDDGQTMGTPSAIFNALQNAGRHVVSDVFVMPFDFEKTKVLMKEWETTPDAKVPVEMPDGETRDRIRKARARPENEHKKDFVGNSMSAEHGPNVHVLLPNNKKDFDPAAHVITRTSKELLPYGFTSPKTDTHGNGRVF